MLNIENLTTLQPNVTRLESIAKALTTREIDLTLCDNGTIQEYNSIYRGKERPTDVLSFPIENDIIIDGLNALPLGSIVISVDFVTEGALAHGHTLDDELNLLFIHGALHLLGYDHEVDKGEMRRREEELIRAFHLPKSLIVRVEEF